MSYPSSIVILPFRLQSERLPEKILKDIGGEPLIVRSIKAVQEALLETQKLLVAVDDIKTCECLDKHLSDLDVIMTAPECPSGTDRVYAAAEAYIREKNIDPSNLKIINVQGDMPFADHATLHKFFKEVEGRVAEEYLSIATPWPLELNAEDPSKVKCVVDARQHALTFTRSFSKAQSFVRSDTTSPVLLHIGVYAYSFAFLKRFCQWPQSSGEKEEKLEQLRALDHQAQLWIYVDHELNVERFRGIDTKADLQWAQNQLKT